VDQDQVAWIQRELGLDVSVPDTELVGISGLPQVWMESLRELHRWSRTPTMQLVIIVSVVVIVANWWLPIRSDYPGAAAIDLLLGLLLTSVLDWYFRVGE
jgi:UDP-N-acetylmuramyl pentapeptide phosphotransferase/UDP-N-acetylglucosamine-1-phosphate transferase